MHILFIGQKTIPVFNNLSESQTEKRVEALARQLVLEGHHATALCRASTSVFIQNLHGVKIKNYQALYLFRAIKYVWRSRPDVVHVHGRSTALIIPLLYLLHPTSQYIWTIDQEKLLPKKIMQLISKITLLTSPTRLLQSQLLHKLGLKTTYVPDGYSKPLLPDTSPKSLGLRKGQYCLAATTAQEDLRWITHAYQRLKTKKPLVVIQEKPARSVTSRRHSKIKVIPKITGRSYTSLIRNAAVVIFGGKNVDSHTILTAMDAARAIIATNDSPFQEILGVTAKYVKNFDNQGLHDILSDLIADRKRQAQLGKTASVRAKNHFTWQRITDEYLSAYKSSLAKEIPLDSAQPKISPAPRPLVHAAS